MKVIIAGSRAFNDYNYLKECCDKALSSVEEPISVICGMAKGADLLGKKYAEENGYEVIKCPPDYEKYPGKIAPLMRNTEMANKGDALILFWDGKSTGSFDMMEKAKSKGLKIRVVHFLTKTLLTI